MLLSIFRGSRPEQAASTVATNKLAEDYFRRLAMNEHFRPVALEHANRLINHGPTVLVTSAAGAQRNVMAAAWSMPVEFTPPRIAVVIDKSTFTRELVMASGAFGLCIPGAGIADLAYAVGNASGRDGDKFSRYGIAFTPAWHADDRGGLCSLARMPPDQRAAYGGGL